MLPINLKTILKNGLWFVNFGSMIKLTLRMPFRANRIFFIFEGKSYTYKEVYAQSVRYSNFFLIQRQKRIKDGTLGKKDRLSIGIYQENTPEYLFAAFGAGLSNSVLFAINTGFRGKTLANVINQAKISLLLTAGDSAAEVETVLPDLSLLSRENILITEDTKGSEKNNFTRFETAALKSEAKAAKPAMPPMDNTLPVLVIYTSGTTGMPKGVPCAHLKMIGAGAVVQSAIRLTKNDRGYICMPLFHSNAWYIGVLSVMLAGASFVLKRRFSASAFEKDILTYGVTFMNYVGQPLHYIIAALEKKYGDGKAVEKALASHPDNRFRIAYGNGASPIDREKCMRYLKMEHIFEIYGSTEAVITTTNKPGDPIESVGQIPESTVILSETGKPCPPGIVGENNQLINYDAAVGEICKKTGTDNLRFDGYFDDDAATAKKFRNGYYHSGDLGHVRVIDKKRYLYFNGRTDDWIRKDGENFSAENVVEYAGKMPGVTLAAAYGAPCEVSDEKVMVTIQMNENQAFDPKKAFNWFVSQQKDGGMDPKWMPDYIRVIDAFSLTSTQKILVRPFKKEHFNIEKHPDITVYCRQRGDKTYYPLTPEIFSEIKENFSKNGREPLL